MAGPNIWDEIADEVAVDTNNLAANSLIAKKRNPALVGRARRLSAKYGIPSPIIEAQPEVYEAQERKDTAEQTFEQHPWMAGAIAADPDIGGLFGKDDVPKVGNILSSFGMTPAKPLNFNLGRSSLMTDVSRTPAAPQLKRPSILKQATTNFGAIVGMTANNIIGGAAGVAEAGSKLVGLDEQLDPYFRQLERAKTATDEGLMDEVSGWINTDTKKGVFSANVSLLSMGSAAVGGAGAVLPLLTTMTFGNAFTKYQGRGASNSEAFLGAGIEGAIEYATEKLPVGYITSKMGKGTVKDFLTQYVLADAGGEQLATLGQSLTDAMIAPVKPVTFKEFMNDPARLNEAYQTLVASAFMSAAVGGGGLALKRLTKTEAQGIDAVDALTGQTLLDNAMGSAATVEMRANSPEDFAKFVAEGAKNSPVKNVYIPIEAVDAALADEALPEEERAALSLYQDQIEEARLNGGDVVVPIGEALASFAGTKLWQSLKDDSRVLAGGISGREARTQMEGLVEELEAIGQQAVDEANSAQPQLTAKAEVYNEVKAQMLAAGRSDKEAQTSAALLASRAETLASPRYGQFKTPAEAWKWMQLQIVGADAKVKGKATKVQQPSAATVNIGLDVNDGSKLTVEEVVAVLKAQGVEITAQEVRQSNSEQTLIAGLSRPLSAEQANAVSTLLRQDAIAQRAGEAGELYGPLAEKWGPFNPDYFLSLTDTTGATSWSGARVDELIGKFGKADGSAKAVAVMMSPDDFLGLTASERGREMIAEQVATLPEYGALDVDKLLAAGPIVLSVTRGGEPSNYQKNRGITKLDDRVVFHDGRHRMSMLKAAGVTQVPVVVNLQGGSTVSEPIALHLAPNRSRSEQVSNGDRHADVVGIPISEAFRAELGGALTVQQSNLPAHEIPSSIEGVLEIARSKKFANQREFKVAVQAAVNKYKGNKRDRKRLFRLALNDARVALKNNANAVGWYDVKVEQALSVLATIHPEIESDVDSRFAFIYALAVTSNGLKVDANFELADEVYREWKATGKMPEVGNGTASGAMQASFRMFNSLTERFGFDGLLQIMLRRDITVKELGELTGVSITGEHKGTVVTGAAFLGPKIGNGFFSNLYGNFDQLTMDRWFIRTWGRWTGTLITEDKAKIKAKRDVVKALIRGLSPAERAAAEKVLKYKISMSDIDGFAKRVNTMTAKADVRDKLAAIHPRLRLDPKALAGLLDGQKEAPHGPNERNEIRSIMGPVLEHLREDNPELTMADLQAVLWYPEKTLYNTATSGGETAVGYEDDEAPDYANAAVALARYEGVPQEKIDEALKAATQRADDRAYVARRSRGAGRAPVGDVPGFAEDGDGFPLEDGLSSERDGTEDPTSYQQFGGFVGATRAQETKGYLAQDMEREGFSPEEIWSATGWMRGPDRKWRFEIDDSKATLADMPSDEIFSLDAITPGIDYSYSDPTMGASDSDGGQILIGKKLSAVLSHPTLFKHYPQLASYNIFVDPRMAKNELGWHSPGEIVLNPYISSTKQLTTLLHEIQHAIQTIEGFAGGANTSTQYLRALGLGEELDKTIAYYTAINEGEIPGATFPRKLGKEELEASAAFGVYQRVAGEVEARNTETRRTMGTKQRRDYFPMDTIEQGIEVLVPQPVQKQRAASSTGPSAPGPRGEATFYPSGKTVVQLFGKADFSTMLHEMSHVFLQQEFLLSRSDGASDELKADIAALTAWFEKNGGALVDGMPDREAHELFARTGERYFREGKAPSAELRGAFTQFKTWLSSIYKSIKDLQVYGRAPITPEIREIMDRMIATEEAIDANATMPMTQDDLGMTTAEYAAYLDSVNSARDTAHDTLLERMMKAIRRREQARGRSERANVRAEVAEQVNADPRFIALHLLRTGRWLADPAREAVRVKIHTGWLIDNYGEDVLKQLPVGLQPLHRGDGTVGDDIAELVGMPSGDALVRALLDLKVQADQLKAEGNPRPLRDQIIEDETDRIMAERHGDVAMSEAEIEEEAIAALNSARQGEVLATELRQLKKVKGTGGVVTPYQLLREWARRKVNEGTVAEAVSKSALQRYIRAFNKARNLFEAAILGGDSSEAIKQKQAQMINHALLAEGKVVADEIGTIVRRMKRYAKTKAMASIDQDYMDRIHELLEGYNFRQVSATARAEQASFEDWAAGQRAQGHEVHVPPRFRDNRLNWEDAQVAKLLELNDMVQSLAAQGKLKQRLINSRTERELAETIDEAESRILSLPERALPDSSTGQENRPFMQAAREDGYRRAVLDLLRPGARVRELNAGLLKIEGLMDVLDGTKEGTGPLNQTVVQPATEAANVFSRLTEEVMQPIIERYRSLSRKQSKRLQDFITINELTLNVSIHEADQQNLGKPLTIPRMKLIGLLLNTGNLSNMSKLVAGERWGDPESASDMARVRDVLVSYASKEDMDLVQDIWNGVGKLWPHIARVERELSGIVPEEVVAVGFDTQHGPYTGGYWPVVWDSTRSEMGKKQGEEAETSLQGVGFGISTPKGHTITRTAAAAPMEWSVETVLFGHMNKVISRIAYAPWVRDTLKIIDNPRVTGAIRLRLGNEYVSMIKPWIRDQIPSNMPDVQGAKFWEKFLTQVRVNMSITVLGVSYTTGVAQMLGLGYSAGVLGDGSVKAGGKWVALGIGKMLALQKSGFGGAQEFVFARSEELRRRAFEVSQESAEVFRRLRDQDTVVRRLQAAAFWHIGFIDLNMVALPTWFGGYHKGLSEGMSEDDAVAYAEKMVRLSQSSGRQKDLSAIQRGNAGQKFISMFYTPSSVFFNQQWEGAQHLKAGNWSKALAPTFWFLAMTSIAEAMMSGDWPEDDEEDGLGGLDIAEWVGRNLMFGAFYGIPVARDVANTTERLGRGEYAEYGSTPLSFAMQTIGRGGKAVGKMIDGEEVEGKDVKAAAGAVGFLMGLPGNQIGKTGGYIKEVYDGRANPEDFGDWYTGLTSGKQSSEQE